MARIVERKESDDIFLSECECITNAVNSIGVMGGGLARAFIQRYPEECGEFNCDSVDFQIEKLAFGLSETPLIPPHLYRIKNPNESGPKWILMFPTKAHVRYNSKYEYIDVGMKATVELLKKENITSIAFPKLGSGLGGLDFDEVYEIMKEHLKNYEGLVEIYI